MATNFNVNLEDLQFILKQIEIAELHAAGGNLTTIIETTGGATGVAPILPAGLRTVDGRYNNLLPGQNDLGAADTLFPRLAPAEYVTDTGSDPFNLGPGVSLVTNTDYSVIGVPTDPTASGSNGGNTGNVVDAAPRMISNLIVDQTVNNKAALIAALQVAGSADPSADADAVIAALQAAVAAASNAAAHDATERAYEIALQLFDPPGPDPIAPGSPTVQAQTDIAVAKLTALQAAVGNDGTFDDPADTILAADALAAVNTAIAAQLNVIAALDSDPNTVAADHLAASQLHDDLIALGSFVEAIILSFADGVSFPEFNSLIAAKAQAIAAAALADTNHADLVASENVAANATTGPQLAYLNLINSLGIELTDAGAVTVENRSPDIGLSPGFNGWMTLFGQFFDHGLDLVTKGGAGKVYIPLAPDDPLIGGADGIIGDIIGTTINEGADDLRAEMRFMVLTRATPTVVDGQAEHTNTTTSWIDQNQTYTSNASHQVFLRDYVRKSIDLSDDNVVNPTMHTLNTGRLLDGTTASGSLNGAVANWGEVKQQAIDKLGIKLSDMDIFGSPTFQVGSLRSSLPATM